MKQRFFAFKTFLKRLDSRGQAIVEFILLLVVLTTISWVFVGVMNNNLARFWEYSVNLVIHDQPGITSETIR